MPANLLLPKKVTCTMRIMAAMFDTRSHAEDAIERLVAAKCPRDAITFMPEDEISEIATEGAYDWREDKWGLWRGLATFEIIADADRYCLAEGMHRGACVLLVAARDDGDAERYGATLIEAGAIDLDEREQSWRTAGWNGFDTAAQTAPSVARHFGRSPRLRVY